MGILGGLCSSNPEDKIYEDYLNKYEDIVGILGKQLIVGLIEPKML